MSKLNKNSWPSVPLGECCQIVSGSTPRRDTPEYWDGEITWATPKDLSRLTGDVLNETADKITKAGLQSCSTKMLPKGTVLFSSRAPIGLVAIAGKPMCTNQGFKNFVPGENVNSSYLYWTLRKMAPRIQDMGNGATFKEVSKSVIERVEIPLPLKDEQMRIAAILNQADSIRRDRLMIAEDSKNLCPAIFHHMFRAVSGRLSGKYIAEKDSNLGRELIEKGWKHTAIGREITLQRGIDITKREHVAGDIPVISSGGVNGFHNEAVAKGPGVILGRKGSVGSVHYVDVDYWPHDTTLWVKEFNGNIARFVYEFFRQFPISQYEASTANPSLNRNNLHPVNVWWPPVSEQQRFADYCEAFDKKLKPKLADASQESDDLFNSLIQRAFKGEL